MVGWVGAWVAGLSKTKTKPNPKLKFWAELCNKKADYSIECRSFQFGGDLAFLLLSVHNFVCLFVLLHILADLIL